MKQTGIPIADAKLELVRINNWLKEPKLLIGGLAVQQYVIIRNSADIDIVCNYELARELVECLYPSNKWKVENANNDEVRPAYHIYPLTPQAGLYKIEIGPKILERQPYEYIEWDALKKDARPFSHKNKTLRNILVPSPAALVFSKIVSFMGRSKHQTDKRNQDFNDIVELSNNSGFVVHDFYSLVGRDDLMDKIRQDFVIDTDEQKKMVSRSIHASLWADIFFKDKTFNGTERELLTKQDDTPSASLIDHELNKVSIIKELLATCQKKGVNVCEPDELIGKTIFEAVFLFEPINSDFERGELLDILIHARRCAFDKKYGNGIHSDERFFDIQLWRKDFCKVLDFVGITDLENISVINVGCGLGDEGKTIYEKFKSMTAVDISRTALSTFKISFPLADESCTEAENLVFAESDTFDLYLSLRVYTSTLFDMRRAFHEARRVLVPGGKCVVSTPTKYLVHNKLADGLARPGLSYDKPDRNYAFEIVEDIRQAFWREGFDDLRVICSLTEAYIIGTKPEL